MGKKTKAKSFKKENILDNRFLSRVASEKEMLDSYIIYLDDKLTEIKLLGAKSKINGLMSHHFPGVDFVVWRERDVDHRIKKSKIYLFDIDKDYKLEMLK